MERCSPDQSGNDRCAQNVGSTVAAETRHVGPGAGGHSDNPLTTGIAGCLCFARVLIYRAQAVCECRAGQPQSYGAGAAIRNRLSANGKSATNPGEKLRS